MLPRGLRGWTKRHCYWESALAVEGYCCAFVVMCCFCCVLVVCLTMLNHHVCVLTIMRADSTDLVWGLTNLTIPRTVPCIGTDINAHNDTKHASYLVARASLGPSAGWSTAGSALESMGPTPVPCTGRKRSSHRATSVWLVHLKGASDIKWPTCKHDDGRGATC